MIGGARPLELQDLTLPEKKPENLGGAVDLHDLRNRATAAVSALHADLTALQTATGSAVTAALLRANLYGVDGTQEAAVKALQSRFTTASAVPIATSALPDLLGVFKTIFGDLTVLPQMTPPDVAGLHSAFAQSAALVASDPAAPARWFQQLTYVRPGVSRLNSAMSLALLIATPPMPAPRPVLGQIPAAAGDRWLALPLDLAKPFVKGRVAFACFGMGNPAMETSFSGLIVDEWPERIPSTQEQAGVAFHYDEPDARAPQSLLLAVCPDSRPSWDDDLLLATLQETLELAQIRTVDLDTVQQVGQILPALYFSLNLQGASLSTNFTVPKGVILGS